MEVCISTFAVLTVLLFTVLHLWRRKKIVDIRKTGKWAVVTGATDGIGKCFTHELAKMGMSVVLISRNVEKLEICAKEIEDTFSVSTKIIQADFTSLDENMYSRIRDQLKLVDIGVLVNNVGMLHSHPEYYHLIEENHPNEFQNVINCNIMSAVNMTKMVLPGMVARQRGLIINVASLFGQTPCPFVTIYGATKSFLAKFSTDLDIEYRNSGVHVHLLRTGFVITKLSDVEGIFGLVPSPEVYVKNAIEQVQTSRDCDGYFGHWLTRMILLAGMAFVPYITNLVVSYFILRGKKKRIAKCSKCNSHSIPQSVSLSYK